MSGSVWKWHATMPTYSNSKFLGQRFLELFWKEKQLNKAKTLLYARISRPLIILHVRTHRVIVAVRDLVKDGFTTIHTDTFCVLSP